MNPTINAIRDRLSGIWQSIPGPAKRGWWGAPTLLVLAYLLLMAYWDEKPAPFDVRTVTMERLEEANPVTGHVTTATLIEVAETLLDKPGGYLTNDSPLSPGFYLDNMPAFEYGMLVSIRDLARVLRNEFSRSQTQSVENEFLAEAEPQFHFDNDSWLFPPTEGRYRSGIEGVEQYLQQLGDAQVSGNEFYARADNLAAYLQVVEKRLGSYSQRLSASVGQRRINTDLGGDAEAERSTPQPQEQEVKTPWLEIDNVFYETQGAAWALLHILQAMEVDFERVLEKKAALVSLRQVIRELESCIQRVWSPMVLNGQGFSMFPNHSLVLASFISRANAAVIDLRNLLKQG